MRKYLIKLIFDYTNPRVIGGLSFLVFINSSMKNYLKRLQEAYEKREARIEDSLARLQKRLDDAQKGIVSQHDSQYLFPEMNKDDVIADLTARKVGLQRAKEVTRQRRLRRFIKSAIQDTPPEPPTQQDLDKIVPPIPPNYPSPIKQIAQPIMLPGDRDPRWIRYGLQRRPESA